MKRDELTQHQSCQLLLHLTGTILFLKDPISG